MVPPILLGIIASVGLGLFLSEFADAPRFVGLIAALPVAAIYVSRSALSDKHAGHWIGIDRHGAPDSGDFGDG